MNVISSSIQKTTSESIKDRTLYAKYQAKRSEID